MVMLLLVLLYFFLCPLDGTMVHEKMGLLFFKSYHLVNVIQYSSTLNYYFSPVSHVWLLDYLQSSQSLNYICFYLFPLINVIMGNTFLLLAC